jgi:thioredoxin reductase (NADPH)
MKPWDPPEQNLYPVLDELLDEWVVKATPPFEGIRVAGTLWSATSHAVKDFLSRNQIPYQWLDIDQEEDTRRMVEAVWGEKQLLPVVFFPDGSSLIALPAGTWPTRSVSKLGRTTLL